MKEAAIPEPTPEQRERQRDETMLFVMRACTHELSRLDAKRRARVITSLAVFFDVELRE